MAKSINHEARPFFVAAITPNKCRFEHGNPSGHAIISIAMYFTFIEMMCREHSIKGVKKGLLYVLGVIFAITMGFSRIYNGVHTYN